MKSNVVSLVSLIIFILGLSMTGFSQFWSADFSTDDLTDWQGDRQVFVVNENNQLQLSAPEAGEAFLYRANLIDADTITFSMLHILDFAPSSSNKSRIYLFLDEVDPAQASGYFIEIGENGSADALNFYYLDNGTEELIASAAMGAMAVAPATVRLSIDIFPNGLWSVKTNYEGAEFLTTELEFMEDRFSINESSFFALQCFFSASRADRFFYDDMTMQRFEVDLTAPEVVQATAVGSDKLEVLFSEPVDESAATNPDFYSLNNGLGNPSSVQSIGTFQNEYILEFAESFDARNRYELTVSGITDLSGNVMNEQSVEFLFAGQPEFGDLFLSEILFDPYPEGEDFIEIYNSSDKNLQLMGTTIRNAQRDENDMITNSIILPAKSYIALTENVDFLFEEYMPEQIANIEFNEIPAFNNDQGNVMLINAVGVVLDSFDYNEDQHFQLIDDTEGVSLERVSFEVESTNLRNWQSAAKNVLFATPGYENSSAIGIISAEDNFEVLTETFSPNQDGDDDQMILSYNFEKSGFVASIAIYDAAGFKIKELTNNELLGTEGIFTWDGTNQEGQIADIGIYLIVGNIFHPDGEIINLKMTTVLADFID